MNRKIHLLIIVLISLLLDGCTAGFVKPHAGSPTMAQSYDAASRDQTTFYQNDKNDLMQYKLQLPQPGYQTSVANKYANVLDSQFPKLPNPQNLMYIFGHYAANGEIPVPGHFITFSMYVKDHYALPDEIQKPQTDGQFSQ